MERVEIQIYFEMVFLKTLGKMGTDIHGRQSFKGKCRISGRYIL